jgi:hypothetical protein
MESTLNDEMKTINQRLARLERAVLKPFAKRRLLPDPNSLWNWCQRDGCTRGCYKGKPQCLRCSDVDPRADVFVEQT